ncbi:integral membrane protein [Streptomyces sp. Amel2xB2]|nr:integral membrane protein [Streptomyces sp. Amel2xB2]
MPVTLVRMKKSVLTRYRVMAYVTAVMLLVLCTCMIFKYGFGTGEDLTFVVSQIHGVLYMIYLVVAFDLGQKARWPFGKLLWVLVSGTIPTAAFFVERKVVREVAPLVEDAGTAPAEA